MRRAERLWAVLEEKGIDGFVVLAERLDQARWEGFGIGGRCGGDELGARAVLEVDRQKAPLPTRAVVI